MTFNALIPELSVSNINNSIRFYTKILGFRIEYNREEDKFAFLSFDDAQIMIEEVNDYWNTGELKYPYGRGINFQFKTNDILLLVSTLNEYQYPIYLAPIDNWYRVENKEYGKREFLIQDPDGYLLRFSQDIGIREMIY